MVYSSNPLNIITYKIEIYPDSTDLKLAHLSQIVYDHNYIRD